MGLYRKILLIILIGIFGCVDTQKEALLESQDEWLGEIRAVLLGGLSEPAGKLHMMFTYGNKNESSMMNYRIYYYNHQGQEVLSLGFSVQNDTISARLPQYNQKGEITELKVFRYPNWQNLPDLNGGGLAKMEWSSTTYFTYDAAGKLKTTDLSNPMRERQPSILFHYNEQDALMGKEYFQNSETIDWHVFEYDKNENISKETWRFPISAPPYRVYFYRYDEKGLLVAKETGELYNPDLELKDVFQYFYDDQGRLVEEKEYYPHGGFSLLYRRTYEYYGSGSVN